MKPNTSYVREDKRICCGKVKLRHFINGLVGLSLVTMVTFVILFLLALFHGVYQLEMFFIMLTTVLSFFVIKHSAGVGLTNQLSSIQGTQMD